MTVQEIQKEYRLSDYDFDTACDELQPLIDKYGDKTLLAVLAWIVNSDAAESHR